MRKEFGATVLGVAVALGGAAVLESSASAHARVSIDSPAGFVPTRERDVKCSNKSKPDNWIALEQGDRIHLKANAAVIPSDIAAGGVIQMDDDADTSTVVSLESKDGSVKNWTVDALYGGSMLVLPCDATRKQFHQKIGEQVALLDRMYDTSSNDPVHRINYNNIEK